MKKILFFLITPVLGFGQYSTYYGTYDINANINQNVNVTQDVNVSGNINKTIQTIDYGALANANAASEKNRIEALKMSNAKDKEALLAIVENPTNAYDYGEDFTFYLRGKDLEQNGLKKLKATYRAPHKSLFTNLGSGVFQNVSENFITTEITFYLPTSPKTVKRNVIEKNKDIYDRYFSILDDVEEYAKKEDFVVGKYNEEEKVFVHKKDINKTRVCGVNGYKSTLIFEDDYEIKINDIYYAVEDGIVYYALASYKADKDEATFEQLEGRKYYMRNLVDRVLASVKFYDMKK